MGSYRKFLLILLILLVASFCVSYEEEGGREGRGEGLFLLHDSKEVVRTDAGVMRVVRRGFGGGGVSIFQSPMHIGFITMEPNSLFIPQYLDAHLIVFVRRGKVFILFLVLFLCFLYTNRKRCSLVHL